MKPRLVIFEPFSSTPIASGGQNRIFNSLKFLSKNFELKVITYGEQVTLAKRNFFSFFIYGIPFWFSPWRTIPTDIPKNDRYLVEFTQLLHLVDHLPYESKKIFVAHDISTISYWRRLSEVNLLKKIIHLFRFIEVYLYEKKYLTKYDCIVAVSQNDADSLKKLFKLKSVIVCPNGIDQINFLPKLKTNQINLGFVGSTSHPPNKAALNFIINELRPQLDRQNINYKLVLLTDVKYDFPNVENLSYVNDISDFYKKIDILVAPIFSGSGSRIKIIESLSFGRQVITTKIGAEGIDIDSPYLTIIPEINPESWIKIITDNNKSISPSDTINLEKLLTKYLWSNTLSKFNKVLN